MKKLKLKELGISSGEVLSKEQLRLLMGGDDDFGSGSKKGSTKGSSKASDRPIQSGKYTSGAGNGCDATSICITSC